MNDNIKASQTDQAAVSRGALTALFLTVFVDLVGFGILIPLIPFLAREYSASPVGIGWLMSIYSIMQLIFAPLWGVLSDKFGRRKLLLFSIFGGGVSYVFFAFATTYTQLFISRALAGFFAATISTAHAYIGDITEKKDRSKYMGLIGAAFGLGFVLGPIMGAGLGWVGHLISHDAPFGSQFAALGAAGICLVNFVIGYYRLPETRKIKKDLEASGSRWADLAQGFKSANIRMLVIVFFLTNFAMALMEVMLFPFVQDQFKWGLTKASLGFAYVGVIIAFTQGYLIRKPLKNVPDKKLLFVGSLLFSLSLVLIPNSNFVYLMALTMTMLAIGNGLTRPSNLGLISGLTSADHQGQSMGISQAVSALGRVLGPVLGGYAYQNYGTGSPFYISGFLSLIATIIIVVLYPKLPDFSLK